MFEGALPGGREEDLLKGDALHCRGQEEVGAVGGEAPDRRETVPAFALAPVLALALALGRDKRGRLAVFEKQAAVIVRVVNRLELPLQIQTKNI